MSEAEFQEFSGTAAALLDKKLDSDWLRDIWASADGNLNRALNYVMDTPPSQVVEKGSKKKHHHLHGNARGSARSPFGEKPFFKPNETPRDRKTLGLGAFPSHMASFADFEKAPPARHDSFQGTPQYQPTTPHEAVNPTSPHTPAERRRTTAELNEALDTMRVLKNSCIQRRSSTHSNKERSNDRAELKSAQAQVMQAVQHMHLSSQLNSVHQQAQQNTMMINSAQQNLVMQTAHQNQMIMQNSSQQQMMLMQVMQQQRLLQQQQQQQQQLQPQVVQYSAEEMQRQQQQQQLAAQQQMMMMNCAMQYNMQAAMKLAAQRRAREGANTGNRSCPFDRPIKDSPRKRNVSFGAAITPAQNNPFGTNMTNPFNLQKPRSPACGEPRNGA